MWTRKAIHLKWTLRHRINEREPIRWQMDNTLCRLRNNYRHMPEAPLRHLPWHIQPLEVQYCKLPFMAYRMSVVILCLVLHRAFWMGKLKQTSSGTELTNCSYYKYLHPVIPVLPESLPQLSAHLDRSPPDVRQAFTAALTSAIKAATTPIQPSEVKMVSDLYLNTRSKGSAGLSTDIVRLQTLIFMALIDELSGSSTSRDGMWLGTAVSFANSLHLNRTHTDAEIGPLQRRAWLSLVILDRWHSAAISGPISISDDDVQLSEEDHSLLGSSSYHLLRAWPPIPTPPSPLGSSLLTTSQAYP